MEKLWEDLSRSGDVLRKREEAVRESKDEFIPGKTQSGFSGREQVASGLTLRRLRTEHCKTHEAEDQSLLADEGLILDLRGMF